MKFKHNKSRPTDRVQIDPRVVIGVAIPKSYRLVATETASYGSWQGNHRSTPL